MSEFVPLDMPEIGDHFVVGLSGASLSPLDTEVLTALRPAGVILRAHNFSAAKPYAEWLKDIQRLEDGVRDTTGRNNPIIAIDHEGGRVHRTPPPLTPFPAARVYRAKAEEVGSMMAEELRSIGINFSFAPVVDVDSNPANPVIGLRAFGRTPDEVIPAAVAFSAALKKGGIVAVAKHFPGHGDTRQDSHEELPVLDLSLAELMAREVKPFRAIAPHVPVILSAHIRFPKIDSENPATLSSLFLRDVLRKELQFKGIIMTDDLDMKAIALNFSDECVAERSFAAGLDMLLFNHDPARALRVARLIEGMIRSNAAFRRHYEESHERVRHFLKHEVRRHQVVPLSAETFAAHKRFAESLP